MFSLTKRDTNIIKGFAILGIVLHNYFHWLDPSPGQNEFDFSSAAIASFFDQIAQQPGEFLNIFFSYFGHFGVQLFIFVSGFGLAISMQRHPRSWESFVFTRLKKLYPLLLTGVVFFIFSRILMEGRLPSDLEKTELGYKLLLIHTLIPDSGISLNGPWWFFGLIFQLYLLFPLLYRWIGKWGWKAFAGLCLCAYAMIFLFREALPVYHGTIVMMNAPGHLPEFCLGILLATAPKPRIHWAWVVLSLAVFCLGNRFAIGYPFTFLAITVVAILAYQGLKALPFKKGWIGRPLAYFGGISMVLFAVHGLFRNPVLKLATTLETPLGHLFSGLLFFLIAWAMALAAKPLYEGMVSLLDRIKIRESRFTRVLGKVFAVAFSLFFIYVAVHYVRLNLAVRDIQSKTPTALVTQGMVSPDDNYVSMASVELSNSPCVIHVEGSFKLKSDEAVEDLPLLVVDVRDTYWNGMPLRKGSDGEWTQYAFSCDYYRPFFKDLNGKRLSVYLWNRHQTKMEFCDVELNMCY